MKPRRRIRSDERSIPPLPVGRWQRWRARIALFHLRDVWWRTLDFFEASRAARVALYLAATALVAGVSLWYFAYPTWAKRNSIRVARQWLESGHLRYAADSAQKASALDPANPEPWRITAEIARRTGQLDQALEYSRRAAELAPGDPANHIAVAADALNAGKLTDVKAALSRLMAEALATSPDAQRILGELARRDLRFTDALAHFEAALKLDGPSAVNEIPLGLILLRSRIPAERQRGLDLLGRWTADKQWGPTALRTLLADALERNDQAGMLRWAEALRAHPRITTSDMPTWLLALSRADPAKYEIALAQLKKDHAISPDAAAQLLGWLNQIGRSADAVAWLKTLNAPALRVPPLAAIAAEAFRAHEAWGDLAAWTEFGNWGRDTDFLRWTYGFVAAKMLGQESRADDLWRTLYNHAQLDTGHALFAASTLYTWGRFADAETLWWRAANQDGGNAVQALAALARHYQVNRDADGQYRAFRRLHLLQSQDADIANNFAFFGLLLGREERLADQVALANLEKHPDNDNYLATRAFALTQQGRAAEAIRLLKPRVELAATSPGLAFAYGMALARGGQKDEARTLLGKLPPASLTVAEVDLIKRVLGN